MQEKKRTAQIFPTIPMRGMVAFPHMVMHFDVAREMSIRAVEYAKQMDTDLFLVAQRDVMTEEPAANDLYGVGVVARVRQVLKTPEGTMRILVEGLYRAKIKKMQPVDGVYMTQITRSPAERRSSADPAELDAVMRAVKAVYENYIRFVPHTPKEVIISVMCQEDPVDLYEAIAFNTMLDYKARQALLEESHILDRLHLLYEILVQETKVLEIEKEIHDRTQENIDREQKEYFLREQLHVIHQELREETGEGDDTESYIARIRELALPEETENKLVREANRLRRLPPSSQDAFVLTNYLDTCLELPWNTYSPEPEDLTACEEILEEDHYGLKKVKERIVETLAVQFLNASIKGQILCLAGPPGIGKSSIAKSVARAAGRKYVRVSLGGVRDEADIRGHRKTYVGAMPGRIIDALRQAGSSNPLILLDEIDKMSSDFKGDPSAAMLEVLDPDQNHAFRDHYLEVPFDLSRAMFIATANDIGTIPAPLRDRMEIIELPSYTREEKFQIARRHLVAKQVEAHGLRPTECRIADDALYAMIDGYTREAGVRNLERTIAAVCRKSAKRIASGERSRISVKQKDLEKLLGIPKFLPDPRSEQSTVGLVNGLAWTSAGGVLMPMEALVLDGKGNIEITGSLGSVMQESARLAVSYARSVANIYHIQPDFYQKKDIHIHAPEGAVPKDGPSAGVTMATAVISALSGYPVRSDVAMTGEITLHGRVMPIGGLREKAMAAYKAGITTVIIPEGNRADLEEVDDIVKENVQFLPMKELSQVLSFVLETGHPAAGKPVSKGKGTASVRA